MVTNPATGAVIADVPRMGAGETRRAIEAAQRALPGWRSMLARDRAAIMRRWADLMMAHQEELSVLLTCEQGKPLAESRVEVAYAASFLEWFGEEAKRVYGDTIPTYLRDRRIIVTKEPVGVTAGITPWNFPAAMPTRKAAPALGAGCTMVLKPAEQTPLTALAVMRLGEEAGLPPGVLSIVTGDADDAPEIGREMTSNPLVRKLGFTGSTEVGKLLMAQCAGQVKKVSLELGGNAPFIVFDDADLDAAVEGAMVAKMRNGGEACTAANRFLVHESVADAFTERLTAAMAAVRVGRGFDPGAQLGPLINEDARGKVERLMADAGDRGARVRTGGTRPDGPGFFYPPTVLDGVAPGSAILAEEVFGPVAPVLAFGDEEDAVAIANDTEHGLVAYVYTRDLRRGLAIGEAIETGMVGINRGTVSDPAAPFGGVKQSGLGREGGHHGLHEFLEPKYFAFD